MELSYFLAKIMGLVMAVFALSGLARPEVIREAIRDFSHESFTRLVVGCLAIGVGIAIILSHNIWEFSWLGLVTLFGWTAFFKGFFYLVAPNRIHAFTRRMLGNHEQLRVFLIACLSLGLYLAAKGFGF